MKIAIN